MLDNITAIVTGWGCFSQRLCQLWGHFKLWHSSVKCLVLSFFLTTLSFCKVVVGGIWCYRGVAYSYIMDWSLWSTVLDLFYCLLILRNAVNMTQAAAVLVNVFLVISLILPCVCWYKDSSSFCLGHTKKSRIEQLFRWLWAIILYLLWPAIILYFLWTFGGEAVNTTMAFYHLTNYLRQAATF